MIRKNPSGHLPVIAESACVDKIIHGCYLPLGCGVGSTEFSEDVARTNIDLVKGYKALQNEF